MENITSFNSNVYPKLYKCGLLSVSLHFPVSLWSQILRCATTGRTKMTKFLRDIEKLLQVIVIYSL